MAKRTETAIKKVAPSFLVPQGEVDTSMQGMEDYIVIPTLKVIQSMTSPDLKERFPEKNVITIPGQQPVWAPGDDPFQFCPHYFFDEWCKWSDLDDTESPMIIARSQDPTSDLAKKARDANTRFEPYENNSKFTYSYVEHLRFVGVIYGDHELAGNQVSISFHRGEHATGRNFITACKMRKQVVGEGDERQVMGVPLWAQVWSFTVSLRDRGSKKWYGLDFEGAGLIEEHLAGEYQATHEELKRDSSRIVVEEAVDKMADTDEF